MKNESETCNAESDPARCALLRAVFAWGVMEPRRYGDEIRTISDD